MTLQTLQRAAGYAGMAKDLLAARLTNSEQTRERAQQHLAQRMGQLRGLPQKLGQMLSFSSAAQANGTATNFANLQEAAEPLPWPTIGAALQEAWECDPETLLIEVDPRGHAASLGQVHQARLVDGREVAIKVQYPGIRQAVQTDMQALGLLSLPLGNLGRGFDFAAYREVIGSDLQRELDYRTEALQQRVFFRQWSANPTVVVPQVIDELSSDTILVSTWETGEHWDDVRAHWPLADRRRLANALLQMFLQGIFQHGLMQADWHPGNLRFRRNSTGVQIVVYDFGCFCTPTLDERLTLARLLQATIDGSEAPWPLLLKLGFNADFLEPLAAKLPAVCRVLFEPFCNNMPYDMADWKLSDRLADILGDDRWNFRIAGPASLIFTLRAFHGLSHYLSALATNVNWQACFDEAIAPLRAQLAALSLPVVGNPAKEGKQSAGFRSVAKHLKIRVTEAGQTKVQLTQAAMNIERLHELLDDDLQVRIANSGIDLVAILREVRQRGYAPGPVFRLNEGAKQIEVSLE
jgi:predicted unusual protein kinase regulating ubiquinone biosynthesis (AarF/ABC1/UbiB family)